MDSAPWANDPLTEAGPLTCKWNPDDTPAFAGPSGSGFWPPVRCRQRVGTLPPRRFASRDGDGPELFMSGTLMKGTGPATPKMDILGRLFSAGPSVITVASVVEGPVRNIHGLHGRHGG
jgi:hypothetical protein